VTCAEHAGGIHYLHVSALVELGMTREALRVRALANLRSRSAGRETRVAGDVWMIFDENAPMSSLMFDDVTWSDPAKKSRS
jgi:hypothetical protein